MELLLKVLTRVPRPAGVALVVALFGALLSSAAQAAPAGFVQVSGEGLVIDGTPWRAIGVNQWDMDAGRVIAGDIDACWYRHADLDAYFDSTFATIKANTGATVVRTFGFRPQYTAGGKDWSSTDKLIHYARKHDVRIIPVFGDQYATCGGREKDLAWYLGGYATEIEQPWGIDYRSYVVSAVARYRDEPTIAFWQLMNEAAAGLDNESVLASFSRAMVDAIRTDGGDTNHLVNLGTVGGSARGNRLPGYADWLACDATGGCNDLAEAHTYNASQALPGLPLPSSVDAKIRLTNATGDVAIGGAMQPAIGGWARITMTFPATPRPFTSWSIELASPAADAFHVLLDDVTVVAAPAPQVYSFETGTDGFSATGATTSVDPTARTGNAALRADIPGSPGPTVSIKAPPIVGSGSSIEAWIRVSFRAPGPEVGGSIAANLHAASVSRRAPFLLGEIGYQAAVPGLARCSSHRSLAERATLVGAMLDATMAPEVGGDGGIVWDWKDPSQRVTLPSGALGADPGIDCWTVTPGDPVEAVLKAAAASVPPAPLPSPPPLPSTSAFLSVLQPPSAEIARGEHVPIMVRLTNGGNAMAGVRMVVTGGCVGVGTTDGLGLGRLTCQAPSTGSTTILVAPDPASCACSVPPATFDVVVKRSVTIQARAQVAERSGPIPVDLEIADPAGGSVGGLTWRIPECGASGVVPASGSLAFVDAACPAGSLPYGRSEIHAILDGDPSTASASAKTVALVFDRIYRDPLAGECIGLAATAGLIGGTARANVCDATTMGGSADWLWWQVGTAEERSRSFVSAGPVTVAAVDARAGRLFHGVFQTEGSGRAFAATYLRPDGAHLLGST